MGIFSPYNKKSYTITYHGDADTVSMIESYINENTINIYNDNYRANLGDIDIYIYSNIKKMEAAAHTSLDTDSSAITRSNEIHMLEYNKSLDSPVGSYSCYVAYQIVKLILENLNPKCEEMLKSYICYYESGLSYSSKNRAGVATVKYIINHSKYRELRRIVIENDMSAFVKAGYTSGIAGLAIWQEGESEDNDSIILESAKSQKRVRCPYCGSIYGRQELIAHIDKTHEDLIPQGSSSTRVVFNTIYKKDHGTCVICGKPTKWNENNARYERFCSDKCKNEYATRVRNRIVTKYGVTSLAQSAEHQEKMLAARSISGKYKFTDGGVRTYTGTYEKKALEFIDKVLNYKSDEVLSPGPIIEYEFEGKPHMWITDIYIVPINLVIEVKDGGSNVNNRPMESYRLKQLHKEDAIKKCGMYNYLRLTDNNFEQLLLFIVELKDRLMDENEEPLIKINEYSTMASMNPVIGMGQSYIIPTYISNCFVGNCVAKNRDLKQLYSYNPDTDSVDKYDSTILEGMTFDMYEIKSDLPIEELAKDVSNYSIGYLSTLYNIVPSIDLFSESAIKLDIINASLNYSEINAKSITEQDDEFEVYEDLDGVYLVNNSYRTPSFESVSYIPDIYRSILRKM